MNTQTSTPARLIIVIPSYNEEEVLPETIKQMSELLDEMVEAKTIAADSYLCLVDDGRQGRTWAIISEYSQSNSYVTGIKLAGNRGHQQALLAGLENAEGDVLVSIDADLQDDINVIKTMMEPYYQGSDIVYGVRKELQELGLDVEVISIGKKREPEKPIEKKLATEGIPHKKWRMRPLPDFRESLKIMRYCQSTNTHVIHSHGYKGNILLGLLPKSKRCLPVISTVHGYTSGKRLGKMALYELLDRYALNRMEAVVLVSEGMRHQIPNNKLKDRLHIIPNGIPLDTPENHNEPIEYFSDKDFKIGALGRLSTEKNFELLIRAMPSVLKEVPSAKLVIYGEGRKRNQLEALIKHLQLQDVVFLPGYLEEPSRLYKQIDVFVNCSISEGMPITLLEAMREGCMIVASDIPANRAILSSLLIDRFIVPLSEDGLSSKIIEINQMEHSQAQVAKDAAKKLFVEKYTSGAMAHNYQGLYRSINGVRYSQFKVV